MFQHVKGVYREDRDLFSSTSHMQKAIGYRYKFFLRRFCLNIRKIFTVRTNI